MPKKQTQTEQQFSPEEWLNTVKEKLFQKPWASGVLLNNSTLFLEVVRVRDTQNVMVRIRTPSIRNAINLTRKEHIDSLIALAHSIVENERNVKDKLEALKQILPTGEKNGAYEEI